MWTAKHTADAITYTRGGLGFVLMWLGWAYGESALNLVAALMLLDWIGDLVDGTLARHSSVPLQTWIGTRDLEVDMFVSFGLMVYLWQGEFVAATLLLGYLIVWALIFLLVGLQRSLGMLFQAPAYGLLIWEALRWTPFIGWTIVFYLAAIIAITWPRFPSEVVPGFLKGMTRRRPS